jgi:Tol biopolymer transport system component
MAVSWRSWVASLGFLPLLGGCAWITRANVDTEGGDPNASSVAPSISADGRYVAFSSVASDLVPGDGKGAVDIFVRDLQVGATTRVSVDSTGGDPNGASFVPSISADGRYVYFDSLASDLVPGDGNGTDDVYVRDLQTGTTTRVSIDTAGGDSDGASFVPSINGSGRYVAFHSVASDLVVGDANAAGDVFVRDLQMGTTTRVSVDTGGLDPNADSGFSSINGSGRYVAFHSDASDLVPGDGNLGRDIFVRDLQLQSTTRVSLDTDDGDPNGSSSIPSISADGRYVAFNSDASDLVVGDTNQSGDVFVHDRQLGTTIRATVDVAVVRRTGTAIRPSVWRPRSPPMAATSPSTPMPSIWCPTTVMASATSSSESSYDRRSTR